MGLAQAPGQNHGLGGTSVIQRISLEWTYVGRLPALFSFQTGLLTHSKQIDFLGVQNSQVERQGKVQP